MRAFTEKHTPPKSHLASLGDTVVVRLGEDGSSTAAAASNLWETQLKPASERWYRLRSAYCEYARMRFARVPEAPSLNLTMARRWMVDFAKYHPPGDVDEGGGAAGAPPGSRSRLQQEQGSGRHGDGGGGGGHGALEISLAAAAMRGVVAPRRGHPPLARRVERPAGCLPGAAAAAAAATTTMKTKAGGTTVSKRAT